MNVLVIDDDSLVALSLKTILEAALTVQGSEDTDIHVVGMGESGEDAIRLYDELRPDVLLMDIRMDGMSGLEAGAFILEKYPDARILFLTTFSDDEYIIRALKMGAKGYILKQDYDGIAPALRAVGNGQSVFGDSIRDKLPDLMSAKEEFDYAAHGISEKEIEILKAVATGLNNKEIAEQMYLSEGTVRNYISALLDKLDLRDRTQLAIFYYTRGEG